MMNMKNGPKIGIITVFGIMSFSSGVLAKGQHENIVGQYCSDPKQPFSILKRYCETLDCTHLTAKNIQCCADELAKYQALGIGDPICVTPKRAYITNFNPFNGTSGNTVTECTFKPDGSFDTCLDSGVGNIFDSPLGIIANKKQDTLYITNYGNNNSIYSVSKCSIQTKGPNAGKIISCVDSGAGTSVFIKPFGIVFNQKQNRVYITNNEGSTAVTECSVSNGNFSNCVDAGAGPISGRPTGIALNKAETIAYITTDTTNLVMKCDVNAGTLSNCVATGSGFSNPIAITLNSTETFAYVTNYSINSILKCAIAGNGDLINCANSGVSPSNFNFPFSVTLNKAGDMAYVPNYNIGTISQCTMDYNPSSATYGDFLSCTNSNASLLNGPVALTLTW